MTHPMIARRKPIKIPVSGPRRLIILEETNPINTFARGYAPDIRYKVRYPAVIPRRNMSGPLTFLTIFYSNIKKRSWYPYLYSGAARAGNNFSCKNGNRAKFSYRFSISLC
jgi:hypothetical protein